ncbi:DUF1549 domain-containing protein [Fimbriiglobus ruber]|uniref:Cytochrome c domain-containing protein n=1 Tax=Fimbriiglobus ruber TaxID=1908690 RepID=A0A225DNH7_9BACT|nr:DUF1549 domain-containing protein [Fimbriiglobus ruber]OWK43030.1 hypothetical protein FRUB_02629 [Fimbriiglobus ruber]
MLSLAILSIGLSAGPAESPTELAAWLDARLETAWRAKGEPPRAVVSDEIFLRRAFLELTGTIPSVAEARDFLEDPSATKRQRLIQTLLEDKRYAEHFGRLWARTMAPAGTTRGPLEAWLRTEFRKNTPFDQTTKAVLTAKGDSTTAGPAAFYFAVGNTPERITEAVARGFLGIRLGCAQCHNHPFTGWKQEDFWGLAAFFASTGNMAGPVTDGPARKVSPMNSSKEFDAKFLIGPAPEFRGSRSARAVLADWLATPENPYFAANVVNRVWQDLCGAGLVSSVDDLDTVEAAERGQVLDGLTAKFVASGFDMRWLIEGICLSKAYQLASSGSESSPGRRPVRTLTPDQVFASLDQSLGLKKGRGVGIRFTPEGRSLMVRLEEARGSTPTDYKGGIPQALLLLNGNLLTEATALDSSLTLRAIVEAPFLNETEKLETLYLAAYSRQPRQEERERMLKVIGAKPADPAARRQAYSNIFWALMNSPEFVLCP